MINKIMAVGVWAGFISLYIASYVLAGFKGLMPSLVITAIWAAIAWIIKADRDKQVEILSKYKAEVHNLRLGIVDFQNNIHLANAMLGRYGLSVKMPSVLPSVLPSVFDERKK